MSTALAPPAAPAGLTAGPPPAASAPAATPAVTPPVAGAPSSAAEATTQQPADPRAPIDALAKQFGYEPSQLASFNDVESAKAAIRMAAESTARAGIPQPGSYIAPVSPAPAPYYAPPQQYAPPAPEPQPVPTPALDLKSFGLEEDEPAAKALRVLEKQLAEARQLAAGAVGAVEAQQQAVVQQQRAANRAQAHNIVDTFADPKYGTSHARTAAQEFNLQRLFNLADAIVIGASTTGRPIPPLPIRLAQARLLDETPQIAAPGAPGPVPATVNALPSVSPPPADPAPQLKLTDKWSENPALMAAFAGVR